MRQTIALIVSILIAVIAVIAMKNYMDQQKESYQKQWDLVSVMVAKRRLPQDTILDRDDVEAKALPSNFVTADMIEPRDLELYLKRSLGRSIDRSGFLMESDFNRDERVVSSGIPPGKIILSIGVDPLTGVSGLLRPRSRVGAMWTQTVTGSRPGELATKTLMLFPNVEVYSIDNRLVSLPGENDKRGTMYRTVTLAVTPHEAMLLTAAQSMGKVTLAMRSNDDGRVERDIPTIDAGNLEKLAKDANELRFRQSHPPAP